MDGADFTIVSQWRSKDPEWSVTYAERAPGGAWRTVEAQLFPGVIYVSPLSHWLSDGSAVAHDARARIVERLAAWAFSDAAPVTVQLVVGDGGEDAPLRVRGGFGVDASQLDSGGGIRYREDGRSLAIPALALVPRRAEPHALVCLGRATGWIPSGAEVTIAERAVIAARLRAAADLDLILELDETKDPASVARTPATSLDSASMGSDGAASDTPRIAGAAASALDNASVALAETSAKGAAPLDAWQLARQLLAWQRALIGAVPNAELVPAVAHGERPAPAMTLFWRAELPALYVRGVTGWTFGPGSRLHLAPVAANGLTQARRWLDAEALPTTPRLDGGTVAQPESRDLLHAWASARRQGSHAPSALGEQLLGVVVAQHDAALAVYADGRCRYSSPATLLVVEADLTPAIAALAREVLASARRPKTDAGGATLQVTQLTLQGPRTASAAAQTPLGHAATTLLRALIDWFALSDRPAA